MKRKSVIILSVVVMVLLGLTTVGQAGILERNMNEENYNKFIQRIDIKYRLSKRISKYYNAPQLIHYYDQAEERVNTSFPNMNEQRKENLTKKMYTVSLLSRVGVLEVHDDLVNFIQMVYELMALITGHNDFTRKRCVIRTMPIVFPVVVSRGGLNLSNGGIITLSLLDFIEEIFHAYGILSLLIVPFAIIIWLFFATIDITDFLLQVFSGATQGTRNDIVDTYNAVDWGF